MLDGTYDGLKLSVADYLNRTDLTDQIVDFIVLAEIDIMRIYAARNNEVEKITDREDPLQDPLTDTIPVEDDYREMLTFTIDELPMTRVSLTFLQTQQGSDDTQTRTGKPDIFARDLSNFVLFPFPSDGFIYRQTYYSKLLALSDTNTTNPLLVKEPGLYLFGALLQAEPFLRGDQLGLLKIWKASYSEILAGTALERDEEDRSGSNTVVQNTFGSRGSLARTGWA